MKKAIAILTAALMLLTLTACGLKITAGDDTGSGKTDKNGEITVQMNGDSITLDYDTHHKDMYFKANLTDFYTDTAGSLCVLSYRQDGDVTYNISIVYFYGKSIEETMAESDVSLIDKTVNGITYKYFEQDFVYTDKTVPGHVYVYNYDNTTYTINFISEYDLTSLETGFLSTVRFEKSE